MEANQLLGLLVAFFGVVAVLSGSYAILRSTQRKQYEKDLKDRLDLMERSNAELKVKVDALEEANKVLAQTASGALAVAELTRLTIRMHDENQNSLSQILKILTEREMRPNGGKA